MQPERLPKIAMEDAPPVVDILLCSGASKP